MFLQGRTGAPGLPGKQGLPGWAGPDGLKVGLVKRSLSKFSYRLDDKYNLTHMYMLFSGGKGGSWTHGLTRTKRATRDKGSAGVWRVMQIIPCMLGKREKYFFLIWLCFHVLFQGVMGYKGEKVSLESQCMFATMKPLKSNYNYSLFPSLRGLMVTLE